MELIVGNHKLDKYNEVEVTLRYDSIADAFSFKAYFDPNNAAHRQIFKPLTYQACKITYKGNTIITGTLLVHNFTERESILELPNLQGYSKPGILQDCSIHTDSYPLEMNNNPTLKEIIERLAGPYKINVVIDGNVAAVCAASISTKITLDERVSVAENMARICSQMHIVLSHDARGNLLLTKPKVDKIVTQTQMVTITNPATTPANTTPFFESPMVVDYSSTSSNRKPIYHFSGSAPWYKMSLSVNGQQMHSSLWVKSEGNIDSSAVASESTLNPMIPVQANRMITAIKNMGNARTEANTARFLVGHELKNIVLSIDMEGWELNGKLVTPNNLITVKNPGVYLYNTTTFFIQQVDYKADAEHGETAVLVCVLPECFNDEPVKQIF